MSEVNLGEVPAASAHQQMMTHGRRTQSMAAVENDFLGVSAGGIVDPYGGGNVADQRRAMYQNAR
eukprot:CAMPEP_0113530154 /NCGR_PEP_ID=MMETSP0015_2-20120614/2782_1 /TAXON_ID=2838 /ORGANISM="Odontella" /LENGTH=64 /DNA_ID=CAMNT_0000428845 /DNA_START=66 /DNA_END=260 /DNA_ORIENTATION=- /assembly_acc=CAM_ASM_000160